MLSATDTHRVTKHHGMATGTHSATTRPFVASSSEPSRSGNRLSAVGVSPRFLDAFLADVEPARHRAAARVADELVDTSLRLALMGLRDPHPRRARTERVDALRISGGKLEHASDQLP